MDKNSILFRDTNCDITIKELNRFLWIKIISELKENANKAKNKYKLTNEFGDYLLSMNENSLEPILNTAFTFFYLDGIEFCKKYIENNNLTSNLNSYLNLSDDQVFMYTLINSVRNLGEKNLSNTILVNLNADLLSYILSLNQFELLVLAKCPNLSLNLTIKDQNKFIKAISKKIERSQNEELKKEDFKEKIFYLVDFVKYMAECTKINEDKIKNFNSFIKDIDLFKKKEAKTDFIPQKTNSSQRKTYAFATPLEGSEIWYLRSLGLNAKQIYQELNITAHIGTRSCNVFDALFPNIIIDINNEHSLQSTNSENCSYYYTKQIHESIFLSILLWSYDKLHDYVKNYEIVCKAYFMYREILKFCNYDIENDHLYFLRIENCFKLIKTIKDDLGWIVRGEDNSIYYINPSNPYKNPFVFLNEKIIRYRKIKNKAKNKKLK